MSSDNWKCESCGRKLEDDDPFRLTADDVILCPKCYDECFDESDG